MLRVGLTGGIGAGKSTVARRLAGHGAVVVDADRLAREVVAPGTDGLAAVADAFGPGVLAPDGSLDRAALGALVFADPAARHRLEGITHPRIRALTEQAFAQAGTDAVVVHDVPLLVELGYEDRYHLTAVVHADADERVRRLVAERGSTEPDARRRVAAQADDDARRAAADVWLDNTGAPERLLGDVDRLWRERLVPFEAAVRGRREPPRDPATDLRDADPSWDATGRRLAARVVRAAGERGLRVDHVGSTAVPGLAAKPVVDLQLVVADLAVADGLADALADAGFPRREGGWVDSAAAGAAPGTPDGTWPKRLHASADPAQPVNLHVRVVGTPPVAFALLFRDWLRADEQARADYEALKRRLAAHHPVRADYAAAKEPWFADVAGPAARAWAEAAGWAPPG
ncbi:dephospho-CoA kinase [Aquipuribacter sp. SD81]|uniref:dephospho-CoA kinase n=1 Tax=Aquipuribacter sp. SD81 TaxID=3127703 RepID=UPI0030166207